MTTLLEFAASELEVIAARSSARYPEVAGELRQRAEELRATDGERAELPIPEWRRRRDSLVEAAVELDAIGRQLERRTHAFHEVVIELRKRAAELRADYERGHALDWSS